MESSGTPASTHGLGYLFTALRCQGLTADEFVLQLTTFLRSLDLLLELIVVTLTPRALTANQVRHGGKQGTDNSELSRIHCSVWPALTALPRSLRPKVNYLFNVEMICRLRRTGRSQDMSAIPPIATTPVDPSKRNVALDHSATSLR